MFIDTFPKDMLVNMMQIAEKEAALNFIKAMEMAGKKPTPSEIKEIEHCAMIVHAYVFSMIKQIDINQSLLSSQPNPEAEQS